MHSFVLLALVVLLLAVPGIAASTAAFGPGEVSVVTRLAAGFGLGYAVAAGCAFVLAAAGAFRLASFLTAWAVVSAALWVAAVRRAPLRDQARALATDIRANWFPVLLGAAVIVVLLIIHLTLLRLLGAPRYVYYLGGIDIANSHGVPASTLEYGQGWPPATDKVVLDSFTGVLVQLQHNVAVGPGVLLWVSILGTALGLWATAWELGLRRTAVLLPVLVLSNQVILNTISVGHGGELHHRRYERVSTDLTDYHAEDFGRAVAFCALALAIYAIHRRKWGPAALAGVVLAAASGTHLVPVVVAVIAICFAGVAELLRDRGTRARLVTLRQVVVIGAVSGGLGLLIRLFAGGTFGLSGASDPGRYTALGLRFDPTEYMFNGKFVPWGAAGSGHWYIPPDRVVADIMAGSRIELPAWGLWLFLAGCVLVAAALFVLVRGDLRTVGVVGAGVLAGIIATSLFFAFNYHVYVDGTFGVRRLKDFASLGVILLGLGVFEALLDYLGRRRPLALNAAAAAIVIAVCAWLLPVGVFAPQLHQVSRERTVLVDWLRANTPCGARFLVDQRTEGTLTSLTGRYALLEGMGPFLRVDKLPYVVNLFLRARQFFEAPLSNAGFLRQHGITYVIVVRQIQLLGYTGPTGNTNVQQMNAAPFLRRVFGGPHQPYTVYRVRGVHTPPVSPLLKGPYLHCLRSPVHF